MQINLIDDFHEFDKLKTTWEAVYSADPQANIFVSWAWLRGFFEMTHYYWFILALRPNSESPYVAFFPLTLENYRFKLLRVLRLGGTPVADYTGFVCLPEYEEQALAAFSVYVQQWSAWDRFHLRDVLDQRLETFLESLCRKKFSVQQAECTCCPYIPLPDTWDQYLQDFFSKNARSKLKRRIKHLESLDGFRVTDIQADNLDSQIETLLTLWQMRWGLNCGGYQTIFRRCFENDSLWLRVLWQETTPMAALAAVVDWSQKTFSACMTGFDDKFAKFAPGRVIFAHSIKYAIKNGFQIYDLLRGDHTYKFSFGATERFNSSTLIARKGLRSGVANTAANLVKRLQTAEE